jgi:MFS family permease
VTEVTLEQPDAAPWHRRLRTLETFRALRNNPNYRRYWLGQLTSNMGTWVQTVAQGWLVYQLTSSPFMLGVVGFVQMAPVFLFSLYGGVMADRIERRRLMVWTQTGMMICAFALAMLTLGGVVTIEHVLLFAFLSGSINAFNTPVRQSIVSDLVRKEDLKNAIAINSTQFQLSAFLGPALAGLTIALVGVGWCFFFKAISNLAVLWTLVTIHLPPLPPRRKVSALNSIREAFSYIRGQPMAMALLVVAAIPSLFARPYQTMLPAFAEDVLQAGPTGLGILQSAAGLGAVCGSLAIASVPDKRKSGAILLGAVFALGAALGAFGLSSTFTVSVVTLFVVGFAQMAYGALNQTFLQHMVPDEMRGRVLSVLTLATFGMQPFGSMQSGTLAALLGPQLALALGGCVCALSALVILSRWPALRRLR